jgi:hypothetical protein
LQRRAISVAKWAIAEVEARAFSAEGDAWDPKRPDTLSGRLLDSINILGHLTEDEARGYVAQARRKITAADGVRLWEGKAAMKEAAN